MDECIRHKSNCSQQCINRKGGFACTCGLGYKLHSDGHVCKAIGDNLFTVKFTFIIYFFYCCVKLKIRFVLLNTVYIY